MDQIEDVSAMAARRYEQIERDLREIAVKPLKFDFDIQNSHIFSMMELAQSYARRSVDFIDAMRELIAAKRVVPASIMGRALIETIGMGCLYVHDMERLIAAKDFGKFETRLERFYAGVKSNDGAVQPIHVMDAMRYFEGIDAEYVSYLENKYGMFSKFLDALNSSRPPEAKQVKLSDVSSAMRSYDKLSEIAHPNGTGVQYLYPDPGLDNEEVRKMRDHFQGIANGAIWQCHFLLSALERAQSLPDAYKEAFLGGGAIA